MPDDVSPQKLRIMRIAAKLFARQGYDATGITEVGEAVGLGKGALYHHIGSKEQLLYDISRAHVVDMLEHGEQIIAEDLPADEKLRRLSRRLMQTIADNLPELTVFFADYRALTGERRAELMQIRDRFEGLWRELLAQGEREGLFRHMDPLVVKGVLGTFNYAYLWLKPRGSYTPEQVADLFVDLLVNGLHAEGMRSVERETDSAAQA